MEADIKLNFNSYIKRSNKAQKHEKKNQWHELNLTGSQTELFCKVVFVARTHVKLAVNPIGLYKYLQYIVCFFHWIWRLFRI